MIRVALVDDQRLVSEGLAALLNRAADIEVVGDAADGESGLRLVHRTRPDVVLMDIRMPGMSGLEATRRIAADPELAAVRIVILTTFDTDEHVLDAVRAGAAGFLLKNATPDEIRGAVRTVAGGEALLSPAVTARVMQAAALGPRPTTHPGLDTLTNREREVLIEVGGGCSNAEIGERLYMSPATARTHVSRLLAKLSARDRAQLVVIAYETGLVTPGRG